MKRNDIFMGLFFVALFLPFFLSTELFEGFKTFTKDYPMISSFLKFALLATLGESIGLRIRTGKYNQKGFGLIPRAVVWGILGLTIKLAFVLFATGTPVFLEKTLGIEGAGSALAGDFSGLKLLVAFCISAFMNLIYAPIMMTTHKITDTHIVDNGGTLRGLFRPIKFGDIMINMNWGVQWHFVFKKTIPFFWIPAHTITFLLPEVFQVLFAAVLGIALGIILAIAAQMNTKEA